MSPVATVGQRPISHLVGQKLEYVRLGDVIILGFSGGTRVLIETVVHLAGVDDASGEDDLAMLLGDVVRAAGTNPAGELTITLASGSELLVGADAEVESWAVSGSDGGLVVCLPKGELAVWAGTKS
jgi:uncharacterized protein DUF6188